MQLGKRKPPQKSTNILNSLFIRKIQDQATMSPDTSWKAGKCRKVWVKIRLHIFVGKRGRGRGLQSLRKQCGSLSQSQHIRACGQQSCPKKCSQRDWQEAIRSSMLVELQHNFRDLCGPITGAWGAGREDGKVYGDLCGA